MEKVERELKKLDWNWNKQTVTADNATTKRVSRSKSYASVVSSCSTSSSSRLNVEPSHTTSKSSRKPSRSKSAILSVPSVLSSSQSLPVVNVSSSVAIPSSAITPIVPSVSSVSSPLVVIEDELFDDDIVSDAGAHVDDENDPAFSVASSTSSGSESIASSESDSNDIRRSDDRRRRRVLRSKPSHCRRFLRSMNEQNEAYEVHRRIQQSVESADRMDNEEYRDYLLNEAYNDLIKRKNLYRKVPAACRDQFICVARIHLRNVSHALTTQDADTIFCAIMGLMLFPSHALKKCRAGAKRKRVGKVSIINQRLQHELQLLHQQSVNRHPQGKRDVDEVDEVNAVAASMMSSSVEENDEFYRRNVVAAVRLIDDAYVSRGMKRLCSTKREVKSFEETYNDLLALHPQVNQDIPSLPDNIDDITTIDSEDILFINHMKSLDTGSAPGVSGWTGNMLSILSADVDCRKYFAHFVCEIINANLPRKVANLLLTSLLIGIPKDGKPGTRPIAIGEIFLRFATSFALLFVSHLSHEFFLPHQYGVNISNGCETVIHTIQQALSHPTKKYYALCIDMKNAFNSISRAEMLRSLFSNKEFSSIFRLMHWCYQSPSPLVTQDKNGNPSYSFDFLSSEGARQGGNESSLLFSIPVQEVLKTVKLACSNTLLLSILDDITLLSTDADELMTAYQLIVTLMKEKLNLVVQPSKCQFIYFNDENHNNYFLDHHYPNVRPLLISNEIKIKINGAIILGSVVGNNDELMCNLLTQHISENHTNVFKCLNHNELPTQYAMLLLRMCALPKLNYILRTVRPSAIALLTRNFDKNVIDTALNVLKLCHVPPSIMSRENIIQQLRLPYKMGGFGLTNVLTTSHFAYIDSVARCLFLDNTTHKLFSHPSTLLTTQLQLSIDFSLNETKLSTHPVHKLLLPVTHHAFICHFSKHQISESVKSLQSTLTSEAHKQSNIALCEMYEGNDFNTARMKCITAKGACRWKSALPVENLCKLSNQDYHIACRVNLGLPPADIMPSSCPKCNEKIGYDPVSSLHFLSCLYMKGKEITDRHNAVQYVVELFCNRAGLFTRRYEHTARHTPGIREHNRTIDTYIQFPTHSADIDYVITHPTAKSYVQGSARTQLHAASLANTRKINHHYNIHRDLSLIHI